MPSDLPETPQPKGDGNPLITNNCKPVPHSEPTKQAKREFDGKEGSPAVKSLKSHRHVRVTAARFTVYADTPNSQKTPASTRLSIGSDAALRDSPKDRWSPRVVAAEVKSVEFWSTPVKNNENDEAIDTDIEGRKRRSWAPSPQAPTTKDETPEYEAEAASGGEKKDDDDSTSDTDIVPDSENDLSSDGAAADENGEVDRSEEEHHNDNKENIPPKLHLTTPSTSRLTLLLKPRQDRNNSTPSSLPSAIRSSFFLPSSVVASPALQSSPSPAMLDRPDGLTFSVIVAVKDTSKTASNIQQGGGKREEVE